MEERIRGTATISWQETESIGRRKRCLGDVSVYTVILLNSCTFVYCWNLSMINSLVSVCYSSCRASLSSLTSHPLPAPKARASKMLNLVNYRLKVTLYVNNEHDDLTACRND